LKVDKVTGGNRRKQEETGGNRKRLRLEALERLAGSHLPCLIWSKLWSRKWTSDACWADTVLMICGIHWYTMITCVFMFFLLCSKLCIWPSQI
jgi:hypothetical protein